MLAQDDSDVAAGRVPTQTAASNDATPSEKKSEKDLEDDEDSADETPNQSSNNLHTIPTATEVIAERSRTHGSAHHDVEQNIAVEKTKSIALAPTKTADGTILVDWYTTDDVANPQNWSKATKRFVLFQLCAYSLGVYGASSMYVSGEGGVMHQFHVGNAAAAMGLAIYVIGYGIGPLLVCILSELWSRYRRIQDIGCLDFCPNTADFCAVGTIE